MNRDDIPVCVVKSKRTGELVPFTLGMWNDVIVTNIKEYNLDDLIVTVERLGSLGEEPDERFFVVMK